MGRHPQRATNPPRTREAFDKAIVRYSRGVTIYSEEKVIEILMELHEWDREEATMWFDYNISTLGGKMRFVSERP